MEIKSYAHNLSVWIVVVVILVVLSLDYRYNFRLKGQRTFISDRNIVTFNEHRAHIFKECFYVPTHFHIKSDFEERRINRKSNRSQCKRFITLERYRGRTGNQMFEIASLLGIAYTYDLNPVSPPGTILNRYFDLPKIFTNNTLVRPSIYDCRTWAKVCNFVKIKTEKGNVTLKGFFQSWKYFNSIRNIIKLFFKFKDSHLMNAQNYLSSVSLKKFYRVCLHIRLVPKYRIGYDLPDKTFFEKARWFYLSNFKRVQFIIVSNNKQWCREHFRNVNISNFTNPGDDLALLSKCDHVVVTSGTFGWWGAWLSGGKTVYYDRVFEEGSKLKLNMENKDFYPPSWIGIG